MYALPNTLIRTLCVFALAAVLLVLGHQANAEIDLGKPKTAGIGSSSTLGSNAAVVTTNQVRAELVAHAPDGIAGLAVGKPFWLGLRLEHQAHWHTYWQNPGDSGLPTKLVWDLPSALHAGATQWPLPQKIAIGNLTNYGYEGVVTLWVPVTRDQAMNSPSDTLTVRLKASWLVCRQECIPQEGNFTLQLPTQGSIVSHQADFASAQAALPQSVAIPAQASVNAQGVNLTVRGLPKNWQGKDVQVLPELPELLENSATPSTAPQSWQADGAWSVQMPISSLRSSAPSSIPLVLALATGAGGQSLRVVATVQGNWPPLPAGASISPALQDALDANAASSPATSVTPITPPPWEWRAFALALAGALLGGLILNLMPCVLPILAIKVLAFANHDSASRKEHRIEGLAYSAGVVLAFLGLGAVLLALRAGGEQLGWGFQLQSPMVVALLALLFTGLGLNLFGVIHIRSVLPSSWASARLQHPLADAFLSGVLAVAVASPCTAPFMGASMGYAIGLPNAAALGIFAALGVGLALPYLALSWFNGLARWLPRPGAWMQTLRYALAFPMWATVVWLLWVLAHLSGIDGALSALALLLVAAMWAWAWGLSGRSRTVMVTLSTLTLALLLATLGGNVLNQAPDISTNTNNNTSGLSTHSNNTAPTWQAWRPEQVQAELALGKPVFVDFTAAWCITCQYNKKVLADSDIASTFRAKNVSLLRADWTRRDPAITQALTQLGRSGVPVYVLYQNGRAPTILSELLGKDELQSALAALP